ncbi:nucleoside phosphorylase domain-containing protein [Syncephalis pseudoplumigaleata]|uniref:Nucleoside phosphorylase domain-containing protein n=1 Tax=Syncephalis pseudoplumigaleata TaxID=1712513 RepID=A0A4P9YXU7_9FUNG|nr:nucleoside phosphorylase domain-containing protein [Syncephalis pseudoplumigaleata]|eukprot:RKP24854.1 nucleoside phosphorylase domain-containing protein [Syncephalis pseudoplumigaleata]
MPSDMKNANFPMDAEGHTYHVGLKRGEVCNRILTVGDPERARRLASLLDQDAPMFERESHRGFLTITGRFLGQPVSIIAIGMGMAMMDFMLREVRAVVDGPLCVIRIGTCGSIATAANVGDIIVPDGSAAVTRRFDAFFDLAAASSSPSAGELSADECYTFSRVFPADAELTAALREQLGQQLSEERVVPGVNVTADTFYAAQGRVDPSFVDRNAKHVEQIHEQYPDAVSLEMENFMLFHLARCATPLAPGVPSIRAAAAMIAVFQRQANTSLPKAELARLEMQAGRAVLDVLAHTLQDEELHPESESVWLQQVAAASIAAATANTATTTTTSIG